jgi:O-antigen/teichoic acid export membrane protein
MASSGLLKASLTLLAGGALAQALPLLLGPWLTRLYSPADFGLFHLFAAVAANLGVVACARYEFALPLARDDEEARLLHALCLRIAAAVVLASAVAALAWAMLIGAVWPLWLPAMVAALAAVSLATLQATREQRFGSLSAARVLQHGGGALGQLLGGLLQLGLWGLIVAPLAAAAATAVWLRLRWRGVWRASGVALRAVAQRHKSFPLLNTPHAFLGALMDTVSVAMIAWALGPAAAGFWGLAMRYLKAPATLVGGAVSQALYPKLAQAAAGVSPAADALGVLPATPAGRPAQAAVPPASRAAVVRVMLVLLALATPLVALLWWLGPAAFAWAFGEGWREAGELARALALYIGVHFVASPLAVATMAWNAQAWALRLALVGQATFVAALAVGLMHGGLVQAGWWVSGAMSLYFGWYFIKLATWPLATGVR